MRSGPEGPLWRGIIIGMALALPVWLGLAWFVMKY